MVRVTVTKSEAQPNDVCPDAGHRATVATAVAQSLLESNCHYNLRSATGGPGLSNDSDDAQAIEIMHCGILAIQAR